MKLVSGVRVAYTANANAHRRSSCVPSGWLGITNGCHSRDFPLEPDDKTKAPEFLASFFTTLGLDIFAIIVVGILLMNLWFNWNQSQVPDDFRQLVNSCNLGHSNYVICCQNDNGQPVDCTNSPISFGEKIVVKVITTSVTANSNQGYLPIAVSIRRVRSTVSSEVFFSFHDFNKRYDVSRIPTICADNPAWLGGFLGDVGNV